MRGVLTPAIELWNFGSPEGLPSPNFGSVSFILTLFQSRVATFHPFFTLNPIIEFQLLHDMLYTQDHTCQSMSNMKASFRDRKTKHMSKNKRKMHHWCLCFCWLLLGAIAWHFITLGSHLLFAFRTTHSKFTQFTFHFYRCFYKAEHAKESVAKRVSKGQCATTNMKNVKLIFEHYCCITFFLKRFIFAS